MNAAQLLILAYAHNHDGNGSIDWSDIDRAFEQAKTEQPGEYRAMVREIKREQRRPEYHSGCGRIELKMTLAQAQSASHPGPCDADVAALVRARNISWQLTRIDPATLRDELRGYGAWDETELADHDQNLQRLIWIAAGDIAEEARCKA